MQPALQLKRNSGAPRRAASTAARALEDSSCRATVSRQLAQLAASQPQPGSPLLTVQQLQYVCHGCVCDILGQAKARSRRDARSPAAAAAAETPGLEPWQLSAQVQSQLLADSASAVMRLEPDRPRSLERSAVADPAQAFHTNLQLRMYRLARQQGSDYWAMRATPGLLSTATLTPNPTIDCLEAAVEAGQQALSALRRCRRLLPDPWLNGFDAALSARQPQVACAERQLQLLRRTGNPVAAANSLRGVAEQALASCDVSRQIADSGSGMMCDGCGEAALGVRRCSRCKQARYCR